MKDKDLPRTNMSRDELITKHKQLDVMLQAELRKKFPDSIQLLRLKRLKAMFKVRIAGLEPKPILKVTADIVPIPVRNKTPESLFLGTPQAARFAAK